jgi:hypothetical protein
MCVWMQQTNTPVAICEVEFLQARQRGHVIQVNEGDTFPQDQLPQIGRGAQPREGSDAAAA